MELMCQPLVKGPRHQFEVVVPSRMLVQTGPGKGIPQHTGSSVGAEGTVDKSGMHASDVEAARRAPQSIGSSGMQGGDLEAARRAPRGIDSSGMQDGDLEAARRAPHGYTQALDLDVGDVEMTDAYPGADLLRVFVKGQTQTAMVVSGREFVATLYGRVAQAMRC